MKMIEKKIMSYDCGNPGCTVIHKSNSGAENCLNKPPKTTNGRSVPVEVKVYFAKRLLCGDRLSDLAREAGITPQGMKNRCEKVIREARRDKHFTGAYRKSISELYDFV